MKVWLTSEEKIIVRDFQYSFPTQTVTINKENDWFVLRIGDYKRFFKTRTEVTAFIEGMWFVTSLL